MIDSHCHLGHIEGDPSEIVREAASAGVVAVIDIGMGSEESEAAVRRAEELSNVYASVGIHPNDLEEFAADAAEAMRRIGSLASRPGVVAVGETGLDFYRERSPRELQEDAFRAHIDLARRSDRALVIHCRDAHQRILDVLDETGAAERVVMHCFSGDPAYAESCADRGYFCSFAGNVTYRRNDELREAARVVPDELLLAETDAPFLAPEPFRGKPNRPALVSYAVRALAEARSVDFDAMSELVRANAVRAFALKGNRT